MINEKEFVKLQHILNTCKTFPKKQNEDLSCMAKCTVSVSVTYSGRAKCLLYKRGSTGVLREMEGSGHKQS